MLRSLLIAIAFLVIAVAPARADTPTCAVSGQTTCTKLLYGIGTCDGLDHIPFKQQAWEPVPIRIVGISISLRLGAGQSGYSHAGNSAHPDIMASQINSGTTATMYPPGFFFTFPARVDDFTYIDAHVGCGSGTYEVWVLLYYELKPAAITN